MFSDKMGQQLVFFFTASDLDVLGQSLQTDIWMMDTYKNTAFPYLKISIQNTAIV